MFLSQIQLNPRRREAAPLLSSPHALHAAVLASFPDPSAQVTGRVLWRLDAGEHRTLLRVVSPERPDFTHIAEQAGWPTREDSWEVRSYDKVLARIEKGQRYGFRLTANPVYNKRVPDGSRGKVHGHSTVTHQERWLLDRQERCGFQVEDMADAVPAPEGEGGGLGKALRIVDRRTLSFSRREATVTLRVATFEGILAVHDRDAIVHALSHGIGRAKGYGCGLLTLAPLR